MSNPETGIEAAMNLIWTPAQLAMLAKVVDLNGFSAAARALAVPKAAVSRAVADLEKTLGVRVLERTTRRISLTSAGRLLYPHARRVGEETDAARSAIAKLQSPEARPLRVVADPTYGRVRSEEHTSELQSRSDLVCRLLLEKKKKTKLQKDN